MNAFVFDYPASVELLESKEVYVVFNINYVIINILLNDIIAEIWLWDSYVSICKTQVIIQSVWCKDKLQYIMYSNFLVQPWFT